MRILPRGARSSSPSSMPWRRTRTRRWSVCSRSPSFRGTFLYTAVLGDAAPQAFKAAADQYRRFGFSDFKLKLSGDLERDRAKMAVMRGLDTESVRVRVDANNLWSDADEAIRFLRVARLSVLCDRRAARAESVRPACPRVGRPRLPNHPRREPAPSRAACGTARSARALADQRAGVEDGWPAPVAERCRRGAPPGSGIIVGAQVGETSLLTGGADRRARCRRRARCAGRRVRNQTACARRLRSAADVRARRGARYGRISDAAPPGFGYR